MPVETPGKHGITLTNFVLIFQVLHIICVRNYSCENIKQPYNQQTISLNYTFYQSNCFKEG